MNVTTIMWKFYVKKKKKTSSRRLSELKHSRDREDTKTKFAESGDGVKRRPPKRQKTLATNKRMLPKSDEEIKFEIDTYIASKHDQEEIRLREYGEKLEVRIAEIKEKMKTLKHRWQWRERMDLEEELKDKKDGMRKLESGDFLLEFDKKVEPYILKINSFKKKTVETELPQDKNESKSGNSKYRRSGTGEAYHKQSLELELKLLLKEKDVDTPLYIVQGDMCTECDEPMMILGSESLLACPKCKRTRVFIQATSSRIAYGEEVEFTSFSYKRQNHFQEWLTCFQAKESTEVPLKTIQRVMEVLWSTGVRRCNEVTTLNVRKALKMLKLRKVYENTAQITYRISGRPPPRMTPQQEEQARNMFSAIQQPFNKHCPPDRRNFLSYAYAWYKIVELMGWDEYKSSFSLLKGPDKLKKQDQIFKAICQDLDWEFIPSNRVEE